MKRNKKTTQTKKSKEVKNDKCIGLRPLDTEGWQLLKDALDFPPFMQICYPESGQSRHISNDDCNRLD